MNKRKNELKTLRSLLNMSQSELAIYLNVNVRTVCRWEKGNIEVPEKALTKIKELYFSMKEVSTKLVDENPDAGEHNVIIYSEDKYKDLAEDYFKNKPYGFYKRTMEYVYIAFLELGEKVNLSIEE